jgi:cytochrome bd-type quinol oxidase subunit 1
MRARRVMVATCVVVLCVASVIVFMFFDGRSTSTSDTIRPFIITMGPAWLLFIFAWRVTAKPRK